MSTMHLISCRINGELVEMAVPSRLNAADFLRDTLGLVGTKLGCEHGVCGTCTVLMDGYPVRTCILLAAQLDGHELTTVEGFAGYGGRLDPIQEAFCDTHALQCGYCTPGMLACAHALLATNSDPTDDDIDEAIGGNICRCTGYAQIRRAIRLAASRRAAADTGYPNPAVPESREKVAHS